jgi:hypothetical protein
VPAVARGKSRQEGTLHWLRLCLKDFLRRCLFPAAKWSQAGVRPTVLGLSGRYTGRGLRFHVRIAAF